MHSVSEMGVNSVPAFLTKIWTLVDDPLTDELIAWDASGLSFHVFDQARFAKEILPHYFKHSNIASFIRQLNMYGFRKVVHVDTGAIKCESDDVEFQHPYFIRGQENLLEFIKRKSSGTSAVSVKAEPPGGLKLNSEDVSRVLNDVQHMKGKQETFSTKMDKMKKENEALWREIANLRQKHMKQQQIVNKLIQFMIHLVGGNRGLATGLAKRKMPLMINDASQVAAAKRPRYNKQLSIEELETSPADYVVRSPSSLLDSPASADSGPVIHDITDTLVSSPTKGASQSFGQATVSLIPDQPETLTASQQVSLLNRMSSTPRMTGAAHNPTARLSNPTQIKADEGTKGGAGTSLDSLSFLADPNMLPTSDSSALQTLSDSYNSSAFDKLLRDHPIPARIGSTPSVYTATELTGQLDAMQDDLDSLKDILCNGQYNFDTSTIMNLLSDLDKEPQQDTITASTSDPNTITGNELVQFQPQESLPWAYPDLSDCISDEDTNTPTLPPLTDLADIEHLQKSESPFQDLSETTEIDPMSFINTTQKDLTSVPDTTK